MAAASGCRSSSRTPSVLSIPVATVGNQIAEAPRHVLGLGRSASRTRALELLRLVGIPDPERRYRAYPHELSGGTRQRVMIAIALSSDPAILLCDEPTTALDVTIQTQILALLADLRAERGLSLVFVTHDLSVVGQVAERLAVMYAGRLVETGPTDTVLAAPRHPYTSGLLAAALDVDTPGPRASAHPGLDPGPAATAQRMLVPSPLPVRDARVRYDRRAPRGCLARPRGGLPALRRARGPQAAG